MQLNVCSLEPPEPMERILDALDKLDDGARLDVLIDREPRPLFGILERNGYRYAISQRPDHLYDLQIWRV
jgi:uncharacterized protein (DUF2249 family)